MSTEPLWVHVHEHGEEPYENHLQGTWQFSHCGGHAPGSGSAPIQGGQAFAPPQFLTFGAITSHGLIGGRRCAFIPGYRLWRGQGRNYRRQIKDQNPQSPTYQEVREYYEGMPDPDHVDIEGWPADGPPSGYGHLRVRTMELHWHRWQGDGTYIYTKV